MVPVKLNSVQCTGDLMKWDEDETNGVNAPLNWEQHTDIKHDITNSKNITTNNSNNNLQMSKKRLIRFLTDDCANDVVVTESWNSTDRSAVCRHLDVPAMWFVVRGSAVEQQPASFLHVWASGRTLHGHVWHRSWLQCSLWHHHLLERHWTVGRLVSRSNQLVFGPNRQNWPAPSSLIAPSKRDWRITTSVRVAMTPLHLNLIDIWYASVH